MASILNKIKEDVIKFAEVVAEVLKLDVYIVDNTFNVIGRVDPYQRQYQDPDLFIDESNYFEYAYILKDALNKRQVSTVIDPKTTKICTVCTQIDKCKITVQISAPILIEKKIIGAISLAGYTEEQKQYVSNNNDLIMNFLNHIADLLAAKASVVAENDNHLRLISMLKHVIDQIEDGIIVMDSSSCIIHANKSGMQMLELDEDNVPAHIQINATGGAFLQFDEYSIIIRSKEYLVAGTFFPIKIGEWNRMLIFKDYNLLKQSQLAPMLNSKRIGLSKIYGDSKQIVGVKNRVKNIADSFSNILITGESGTGKELFARALHEESSRRDNLFIALNCAAVPENLLESELFGYVKGAFTGADPKGKIGKIELANNGTLFLDEIGDMPYYLQSKLLRVLEQREFERLGDNKTIKVTIRIVAATHKNLEQMVFEKIFREDLYYRLNVIPLHIPPLREREEDIILLANAFLNKYTKLLNKTVIGIHNDFYKFISIYSWPGNVRELQNVMEYVVNIMDSPGYITASLLEGRINTQNVKEEDVKFEYNLKHLEKELIIKAINHFEPKGVSRDEIAKILGISPATLYRRLQEYE